MGTRDIVAINIESGAVVARAQTGVALWAKTRALTAAQQRRQKIVALVARRALWTSRHKDAHVIFVANARLTWSSVRAAIFRRVACRPQWMMMLHNDGSVDDDGDDEQKRE